MLAGAYLIIAGGRKSLDLCKPGINLTGQSGMQMQGNNIKGHL